MLTAGPDSFTYDANGNQLAKRGGTTVTYDPMNRPTRIVTPSGSEDNTNGPSGERIYMAGASIEGGNVSPQYDTTGNPVTDVDGNSGIWTHRLYGPGIDEPLAEWRRADNRISFLHRDALGSITSVCNAVGQVAYDTSTGRFLQNDSYEGCASSPAILSRYVKMRREAVAEHVRSDALADLRTPAPQSLRC